MQISLRQLEVFVATARSQSLGKAADQIGLTRSAASMALSSLEEASGGPLFTRAGRGLLLNDRGRRLLPGAEGLVEGAREWLSSARGVPGELLGNLRLGCSLTVGNYCLPPLLPAFSRQHPRAGVSLRIANSSEICEELRQARIDLAVIESEDLPADLDAEAWLDDEMILIATPRHPLGSKGPLRPADLSGQHWILREKGSGSMAIAKRFLDKIPRVAGLTELGGTEAIKRAVAGGLGLALVSSRAAELELVSKKLIRLPLVRPVRRRFHILSVPGQHTSTLASGFRAWLRSLMPAGASRVS